MEAVRRSLRPARCAHWAAGKRLPGADRNIRVARWKACSTWLWSVSKRSGIRGWTS